MERRMLDGCSDGNCVIVKPVGMHTNGGCRCFRTPENIAQFRTELAAMKLQVGELQKEVESRKRQLSEWYGKLQGTDALLAESNRLFSELKEWALAVKKSCEVEQDAAQTMETKQWWHGRYVTASAVVDKLSATEKRNDVVGVCDSCGWNNDANHGGFGRVMYTVGKVTLCGSCLPTSR